MKISIFGLTIAISKNDKVKHVNQINRGFCSPDRALKVAEFENHDGFRDLYLVDNDGYILPNQVDLTVNAPLNGPLTATCTFALGGVHHNPKEWVSRNRVVIRGSDIISSINRIPPTATDPEEILP